MVIGDLSEMVCVYSSPARPSCSLCNFSFNLQMEICSWTFLSLVVSNDKFPIRCVARTSDIFSIGKLVPSLLGPVVPWDCLHFTNDGCSLLQSLCGHYLFCSCHLSPVTCGHYLCAPVRASWCTPSCHFACSSSGFLVYSLVPFCLLQFVLFGGLPRAILRAPVCAFWRTPSCQFVWQVASS